jgi:hypothetical protein
MMPTRKNNRAAATRRHGNSRAVSRKVCPPGQRYRKSFVRRFSTKIRERGYTVKKGDLTYRAYPTSGAMVVHSACVKDQRLETHRPPGFKPIGPLRKGELKKYGYTYRKDSHKRHAALRHAVKEFGALNLFHKLDAVAKLAVRKAPDAAKVFREDRDWVREHLGPLHKPKANHH